MAGRRDTRTALSLEGLRGLPDRVQRLVRQVRAVPIEEHHERRCLRRRGNRRRRRGGGAELDDQAQHYAEVVVTPGRAGNARVRGAVVAAIYVDSEVGIDVPAETDDALVGELRA